MKISTEDRFDRKFLSTILYRFAWGVEFIAVAIGLAISVITAITYFDSTGVADFSDWMNAIVGSFPFVIIAVVELTKIPLSGAAFYSSSFIWKALFTLALAFVAVITFETMFNGLERFFVAQTSGVVELKKKLVTLEEKINDRNEKIDRLKEITLDGVEKEYNQRRSVISADRDKILDELEKERRAKRIDTDENLKQLRIELKDLREEKQRIIDEIDKLTTQAYQDYEQQLKGYISERDRKSNELKNQMRTEEMRLEVAKRERDEADKSANFFTRAGVLEKHNKIIADKESIIHEIREDVNALGVNEDRDRLIKERDIKIKSIKREHSVVVSKIDSRIRAKAKEVSEAVTVNQNDVDSAVARIEEEMGSVREKFTIQEDENRLEREKSLSQLHEYEAIISSIGDELELLEAERTDIRSAINLKVEKTQVYRMAMWWTGNESAADVEKDDVATVAFVWFGSLSAIAAFTGIILAVASYAVTIEKKEKINARVHFYGTIRRFIIFLRKKSRAPKIIEKIVEKEVPIEVVKEVAVDKVVLQEKPVEIIKKVIVHVPMYTNDPELLGKVES